MRRGLKLIYSDHQDHGGKGFKPIPDEEGTETITLDPLPALHPPRFKPIPDEEGTETSEMSG